MSIEGEHATQVAYPPGWEARLGTIFLLMNALGDIAGLVCIFQGAFGSTTPKRTQELAALAKFKNVKVMFQRKAWMDGKILDEIVRKVLLPHVRDLWAADNIDFAECFLQLDNGPGRGDEDVLKHLKDDCKTLLEKGPANQTHHIQLIDDNCGRLFRDVACDFIEDTVLSMDKPTLEKLSLVQKRAIMVEALQVAFDRWMTLDDDHYRKIGARAALRTGLAMRIDDDCAGVRPVRFPESYPSSILPTSGAPVRAYTTPETQPPPVIRVIAEAVQPSADRIVPVARVNITQTLEGVVNVILEGPASLQVSVPPSIVQVHEEVGIFDGWSDEKERIYLDDEIDQQIESSSSEDDSAPSPRRFRARTRWCLLGCECEKERGRKCLCERRGSGYCSAHCGCDKSRCRAQVDSPENDD